MTKTTNMCCAWIMYGMFTTFDDNKCGDGSDTTTAQQPEWQIGRGAYKPGGRQANSQNENMGNYVVQKISEVFHDHFWGHVNDNFLKIQAGMTDS